MHCPLPRAVRRFAVLLVPLLLLLPGSASGTAAAGTSTRRVDLTLERDGDDVRLEGVGGRIEEVLLGSIDPLDARTLLDGLRAFLQSETGERVPDLRPDHTAPDFNRSIGGPTPPGSEAAEEEEPQPSGIYAIGVPTDDLDGDGLGDTFIYEIELPDEVITLRAVRGLDGAELWQQTIEASDAVGYNLPDVTGDGVEDIFLFSLEVLWEEEDVDCSTSTYCRESYAAEYIWRAAVRSGADGQTMWGKAYPGEIEAESEYDYRRPTERHRLWVMCASNLQVIPYLAGDHDDDGLRDIVIDAIDIDEEFTETETGIEYAFRTLGDDRLRATTRAELVSGHDGAPLYARASGPGPGIALLWPAFDLVGDEHVDFGWETHDVQDSKYECLSVYWAPRCTDEPETNRLSYELEMVDGGSFSPAWELRESGLYDAFLWELEDDLDGDGRAEQMLFGSHLDGYEEMFSELLVSGGTGEVLWRRASPIDYWEFPVLVASLGGGPSLDLALGSLTRVYTYDDSLLGDGGDSLTFDLRFARLDGGTGAVLAETTTQLLEFDPAEPWIFGYAYLGGILDMSGDGEDDLYGGVIVWEEPEEGEPWAVSALRVETGDSATRVYDFRREEAWMFDPIFADLNGDGTGDAFEFGFPLEEGPFIVQAVDVRAETALWYRDVDSDHLQQLWYGLGDVDGIAGDEVVLSEIFWAESTYRSEVYSLSGSTGLERWRRSYGGP